MLSMAARPGVRVRSSVSSLTITVASQPQYSSAAAAKPAARAPADSWVGSNHDSAGVTPPAESPVTPLTRAMTAKASSTSSPPASSGSCTRLATSIPR